MTTTAPLFARAALTPFDVPTQSGGSASFMYMPAGRHVITPRQGGKAVRVEVLIEPGAAGAIEQQRAALAARGAKPFFDFNHEDREASFWPSRFVWAETPQPGVYAEGEWSAAGLTATEGKEFRQFSPIFYVDDVKAKPARVVCNDAARPNMGGLVNNPAFKAITPFFAKDAAEESGGEMTTSEPPAAEMLPAIKRELTVLGYKNAALQHSIAAADQRAAESGLSAGSKSEVRLFFLPPGEMEFEGAAAFDLRPFEGTLSTGGKLLIDMALAQALENYRNEIGGGFLLVSAPDKLTPGGFTVPEVAFEITRFEWSDGETSDAKGRGIYVCGEWSEAGQAAAAKGLCDFIAPLLEEHGADDPAPHRVFGRFEAKKPYPAALPAWTQPEIPAAKKLSAREGGHAGASGPAARKRETPAAQQSKQQKKDTTMSVTITREAPRTAFKQFAEIVCKNIGERDLSLEGYQRKAACALEAGIFYRSELRPIMDDWLDMPISKALAGSDNTSASIGTLSGTMVMQESLEIFVHDYPLLSSITTDFAAEPGQYQQTQNTRVNLHPGVQSYNGTLGSNGRPAGWDTASPSFAIDVPVTLDEYIGVPIVFGQNTLGATMRNLFQETAPLAADALGGYMVNKVDALCTAAHFNAFSANSFTAGATTNGSSSITMTSTVGLVPGVVITGTNIPAGTMVVQVNDATTATLNKAATGTATGLTFSTSDSVPDVYATYAQARADFNMSSLDAIGAAFDQMRVPTRNRIVQLNSAYYSRLRNDPAINTFYAAMVDHDIIQKGNLPELVGFIPQKAPWFPSSSNRVGFAGHKASLIAKTRLPNDFAKLGVPIPGSITTVTHPGTGMSVSLVQYVNLTAGYAEFRPEVMIGAAVGDKRGGMVLTSQ